MRIVFFGTPAWAVPSLEALLASDLEVVGVVTNPDRPAGRGMNEQPSPVKKAAAAAGLEVLQPASARTPELLAALTDLRPDIAVVVAYGKILPPDLLAVPPLGFVNVHFSILPEYRGAAPVQRAVMEGKSETGVSLMVLTEGMDEGPVLAIERIPIAPDDTAGTIGERLAEIGARLLVEVLPRYADGELEPRPQDHERATYAPKLTAEEARIDWSRPAEGIDAFVRGLHPAPGAWTLLDGKRLKIESVRPAASETRSGPGEIVPGKTFVVGTGTGALELVQVQLAGKRSMSGAELLRGLHLKEGATLG